MIWTNQFVHLDWIHWNNDKEKKKNLHKNQIHKKMGWFGGGRYMDLNGYKIEKSQLL